MPSSRMPKSMAEKEEVVQWIEKNGGVPTPAAVYFKNERGWKVSEGQRLAASELGDADFVASDRWVNGFMRRYGLSLRRTTNLTVLTDDVLTDRAESFLSYLTSRIDGLRDDHTILMDETAVYFEDPRRQTADQVGARHVVLKSTGFASMQVAAVLAVTATGRKLPPLVV
ncbi:unnamed protein product [Phytophthora fragariaefolia]|uniref:Unnamed protein product n=1 Tax=Phytophthora fragariaefolia TaxID=1490495 RepID=A0A9W6Y5H4_9STRA|nr:unnamed protein product [Phytophthora fragariaefolia]